MKCPQCKNEIPDKAKFCPRCGVSVINIKGNQNLTELKAKPGKRRKIFPIVFFVTCVIIFCTLFSYANFFTKTNDVEKRITTYSNGDTVYKPDSDNCVYDEDECTIYYNNLLIAYLFSDLDTDSADALAESVGGKVVGDISGCINVLQIMVVETDLVGLNAYAETLMESDDVIYATYDFPMALAETSTDENPWSDDGNVIDNKGDEENPDGNDWWAEAIGAYTAWDYVDKHEDELASITVGVIDNGFDLDHDDLENNISLLEGYANTEEDHGTHVSGIIAAENNEIGIRGIADNAILLCADWSPDEEQNLVSSGEYIEMTKAMIENGARVINNSWGGNRDTFREKLGMLLNDIDPTISNRYNDYMKAWERWKTATANECIWMIVSLIISVNRGEISDFMIIKSAGNEGYEASDSCYYAAISENLSSYNSLLWNQLEIDDDLIKSHVMIVGAVDNNVDADGNYYMTAYSNYGEGTVDICAPGGSVEYGEIYSTLVSSEYGGMDMHGTSMAAPMASGAAALLWSLNPELSAAEVKKLLVESSSVSAVGVGDDEGTLYPMLNVGNAVMNIGGNIEKTVEKVELERVEQNGKEYAVIEGIAGDGSIIWKKFTGTYEQTELLLIEEIGIYEDRFFYNECGTIVSLNLQTGELIWENSDFCGASISSFVENGTLYLCGYYGPDFYALSCDGETICRIEYFDEAYYWPVKIEKAGEEVAVIFSYGPDGYKEDETSEYTFYVNLDNFSFYQNSEQLNSSTGQQDVLSNISGDWTDGYTEYRFFENETYEENTVFFSSADRELIFRNNVEEGVVEVTGINTANLAPYVQPNSLQTWTELIYDSQTDTIYVGNTSNPYYREDDWINGNISEADTPPVIDEATGNTYGDNISWTISDSLLTATGVGMMENYTKATYVPWYDERTKVTTVIVEGTITSVGSYAFDEFGKMTSITLPDTIRRIEEFAFWKCDDLPEIKIPNDCTVIANNAFNWCKNLKCITLPVAITEIQWNAFANCEDLSDVYYEGTEEQWKSINISNIGNENLLSATVHYNYSEPNI